MASHDERLAVNNKLSSRTDARYTSSVNGISLFKMPPKKSSDSFKKSQLLTFAILFGGYASYTYNRKSVSFALPSLIQHGLVDKSGAGTIASCQNAAYAISKFFGGVLSDKISARWLFFAGLLLSGLATLLFSTGSGIAVFAALWFLNGFAQGAGWPACAKLLKSWFSPLQFGTYWSALSASSNVSGSLCPFLAAWIVSHFDWRTSLVAAGLVTLTTSLLVILFLRDSPKDAGFSEEFSVSVAASKTAKTSNDSKKDQQQMTWKDLLKSPFLKLVSVSYLVVFAAKTCVSDWGQLFIIEDLGQSAFTGSAFVSAVETGGFVGGIAAGYVTDYLKRNHGSKPGNPRMPAAVVFMAGVGLHLFLLTNFLNKDSSQWIISAVGFGVGACLFACIAIFGIVASESYPAHLSGTAHAIVALAANVGAVLSGLPCSYIAQLYNWRSVFLLIQWLTFLTAIVMFVFRKVSPQHQEKKIK